MYVCLVYYTCAVQKVPRHTPPQLFVFDSCGASPQTFTAGATVCSAATQQHRHDPEVGLFQSIAGHRNTRRNRFILSSFHLHLQLALIKQNITEPRQQQKAAYLTKQCYQSDWFHEKTQLGRYGYSAYVFECHSPQIHVAAGSRHPTWLLAVNWRIEASTILTDSYCDLFDETYSVLTRQINGEKKAVHHNSNIPHVAVVHVMCTLGIDVWNLCSCATSST